MSDNDKCSTHHHACDCREAQFNHLVQGLYELCLELLAHYEGDECAFADPAERLDELRSEAESIGAITAPWRNAKGMP